MIETECKQCGKKFLVRKSVIKMGWGKFCSSRCQYLAARTSVPMECFVCRKTTVKTLSKVKRSKSKKYFCSKSCQTVWRNKFYSGSKHMLWKGGFGVKYRKILKGTKMEQVCAVCALKDLRVLVVHHIDKDRSNNIVQNLIWLCRNCHFRIHYGNMAISCRSISQLNLEFKH